MVRYENECADCGYPCLGQACIYRHMAHYYCDECNRELDEDAVYDADGLDLCWDCKCRLEDEQEFETGLAVGIGGGY